MTNIEILEALLPVEVVEEIATVLCRGSHKEGFGILNCHRNRRYYFWKFTKHLSYYIFLKNRQDKDSHRHHLAHAIIRLMQLLGADIKKGVTNEN